MEFEVEQHMWLNIWNFKMLDGLAPQFTAKYATCEALWDFAPWHTLTLPTNFMEHLTFHISKLKLFLCDKQRLD
jgi:hypothetical protein